MARNKIILGVVIGIVGLLIVIYVVAKINHVQPLSMVSPTSINTYSGVAIKGYDPISFFTGVPRLGSEEFETTWRGAKWRFTSLKNMNAFRIDPAKYAPQFGGYCSFAVTTGYTANIDPNSYLIKDDKLYLFNGPDLKINFMMDVEESVKTAEKEWGN